MSENDQNQMQPAARSKALTALQLQQRISKNHGQLEATPLELIVDKNHGLQVVSGTEERGAVAGLQTLPVEYLPSEESGLQLRMGAEEKEAALNSDVGQRRKSRKPLAICITVATLHILISIITVAIVLAQQQ